MSYSISELYNKACTYIEHHHRKAKHHTHRHIHIQCGHIAHMIAHHTHTVHALLIVSAFAISFMSTGLRASPSALSKVDTNISLDYPLQQVTTLECRARMLPWSQLPDSCKISLPIIQNADYKRFEHQGEYKNIYTVLRGATYPGQWDIDKGDHAGVDIASAQETPLYSIAHGIVTFAGTQAGYGNVVKIMFRYNDKTYHAVYGHMHSIAVRRGDIIAKGQFIGELGNTGSTFGALGGNHVHFEIAHDNGGRPAFYYAGCPALQTHTFTQITNGGLCRSYREQYSVDPIAFIEASRKGRDVAINHPVAPVESTPLPTPQLPVPVVVDTVVQPLSNRFLTVRNMRIERLPSDAIEFLREWDIQILAYSNTQMNIDQEGSLTIFVTRKSDAIPYHGQLPLGFTFASPNNAVDFAQQSLQYLHRGQHQFSFIPRRLGRTTIAVSIGGQTFATLPIEVVR